MGLLAVVDNANDRAVIYHVDTVEEDVEPIDSGSLAELFRGD